MSKGGRGEPGVARRRKVLSDGRIVPATAEVALSAVPTGAVEDLGFEPAGLNGRNIVQHLDDRLEVVAYELEHDAGWDQMTDPSADRELVRGMLRELFLEAVVCEKAVGAAAARALVRLPPGAAGGRLRQVFTEQVDEFRALGVAAGAYRALGGDQRFAEQRRPSPAALAFGAVWERLATGPDPFAVVGAVYVMALFAPMLARRVQAEFVARGGLAHSLGVPGFRPPLARARGWLLRQLVAEMADEQPGSRAGICYGVEYLLEVYPLPLWRGAVARAEAAWADG